MKTFVLSTILHNSTAIRNEMEQIINDYHYLSTNSPHMHASPPSIKWDEFTVLLNAKGSHA